MSTKGVGGFTPKLSKHEVSSNHLSSILAAVLSIDHLRTESTANIVRVPRRHIIATPRSRSSQLQGRCENNMNGMQPRHRRITARDLPAEVLERILVHLPTNQERCDMLNQLHSTHPSPCNLLAAAATSRKLPAHG